MAAGRKNRMVEVRDYCLYIIYTNEHHVYIGITKNYKTRIQAHLRSSSNFNLRKIIDQGLSIFVDIIHKNLTANEANDLEIKIISEYLDDPFFTVLNKNSGGLNGGAKGLFGEDISSSKLLDEEIIKIRNEYYVGTTQLILSERYNVAPSTIQKIVRGERSPNLGGPIILDRNLKYLSDADIFTIRTKYANLNKKFIMRDGAIEFKISREYFARILKGEVRAEAGGPILGIDYDRL